MIPETPTPHAPGDTSSSTQEILQSQSEFLWEVLKETGNGLMKAITFNFAILAATLGYVLSHPLALHHRIAALVIIGSISGLFIIAFVSISWGFWVGMSDLESVRECLALGRLSKEHVIQLRLSRFFRRTRVIFLITIGTLLVSLVILLIAIFFSLF
ncbi:MAG TPA: hypothetical protein VN643_19040 [Pyrinomonadaceae bacterium]|nr:hypothetical protein [Pyrinomonadaceae bacterium]